MRRAVLQFFALVSILIGIVLAIMLGEPVRNNLYSYTQAFVMKIMAYKPDGMTIFAQLFLKRMAVFLVCFISVKRYNVIWPTCLMLYWYLFCVAFVLTELVVTMGIAGIKLMIAFLFPQCFLYVVAGAFLLKMQRRESYFDVRNRKKEWLQGGLTYLVVVTAVLTECYVNPFIFLKFFKNYFVNF